MRNIILALALALAPTPARSATLPIVLPVAIVVVESPGETLDAEQRTSATQAVADALDWWAALAPRSLAWEFTDERTISAENPFIDSAWLSPHLSYHGETIELYLVANHATHRGLLGGGYAGFAAPAYRAAVVTTWSAGGAAPAIAHELGHVLYGLPDLYTVPGGCAETDIMCEPTSAYRQRWIGCESLAALGAACNRAWLPVVAT